MGGAAVRGAAARFTSVLQSQHARLTFSGDNVGAMTRRPRALWAVAALLAAIAVLLVAQPAGALPWSLANYFFGPKLVRAEVIVRDGGVVHDYRLDQGVVRAKAPGSITLRERDGQVVTIAVAPTADIQLRGAAVPFARLRIGMHVLTVREGDGPATVVRAYGR
jgi:hypothetical protein